MRHNRKSLSTYGSTHPSIKTKKLSVKNLNSEINAKLLLSETGPQWPFKELQVFFSFFFWCLLKIQEQNTEILQNLRKTVTSPHFGLVKYTMLSWQPPRCDSNAAIKLQVNLVSDFFLSFDSCCTQQGFYFDTKSGGFSPFLGWGLLLEPGVEGLASVLEEASVFVGAESVLGERSETAESSDVRRSFPEDLSPFRKA